MPLSSNHSILSKKINLGIVLRPFLPCFDAIPQFPRIFPVFSQKTSLVVCLCQGFVFFFFALKVPDRHVTLNENICFNQLAVGGQKKIKHREVMWMNPNKYTFLFD